ncbi:MAG: trypsin-like peptidase domain-containing protein [Candidatus Aureabacteria bacterium]|nr:trypsin-like peptidase domain-containing protein [Candidatus Auribacterota bacterium]
MVMRRLLFIKEFLFIAVIILFSAGSPPAMSQDNASFENSVVKIISTSQIPDFYSPWRMKKITTQNGTGFIIEGNRIMTNAHVVADAKYIVVRKNNDPNTYTAEIEHIGHDCDLAILKVNEDNFFAGTASLEFSELPRINDTVYAYGYPIGGEKVSVTKGIVSRIDYIRYTHSGIDYHLAIQIDAAINPGNSGGPIVKDGKVVGVAFQSLMWAENSSYMIPYPVIERFLRDTVDGRYDGYIELGFYYQELENTSMREFYQLSENLSGVLITDVFMKSADNVLQKGDILLSIDGYSIANDGTIVIWNERLPLTEAAEIKLEGQSIAVKFLRGGEIFEKDLVLEKFTPAIELANSYNSQPEYLIIGGLVFVPLSREFLKTWGDKWYNTANKKLLYNFFYYITDGIYKNRPSMIVLSRRMPDPVNTYCENYEDLLVDTINGSQVSTLKDMKELVQNLDEEFLVIEFQNDVTPVVLKTETLKNVDKRIMERYNISSLEYLKEPDK